MLSNIVFCMVLLLLCRGLFVIQTYFWMTTGDSDVESESPFSYLKDADPPYYRSHRFGDRALWCIMEKLLPFRASVIPILLTGNIGEFKHNGA